MKTFRQFLREMAVPLDVHKSMTFYHGTGEDTAKQILKTGVLKGRDTQGKSQLAPMKGHVYITPHLKYAQIYGIGGDMAGEETAHKHAKGDHAYVFEIKGEHLKDIHPDEDSVGEMFAAEHRVKTTWEGPHGRMRPIRTPEPANVHPFLKHMAHLVTPNQMRKAQDGEYAAWAQIGKKLNKHMSPSQKIALINGGAHIAHNGEVPVSKAWRVHKSKFKLLKRDGSNFFEHAEEVPLK